MNPFAFGSSGMRGGERDVDAQDMVQASFELQVRQAASADAPEFLPLGQLIRPQPFARRGEKPPAIVGRNFVGIPGRHLAFANAVEDPHPAGEVAGEIRIRRECGEIKPRFGVCPFVTCSTVIRQELADTLRNIPRRQRALRRKSPTERNHKSDAGNISHHITLPEEGDSRPTESDDEIRRGGRANRCRSR